jgi:hypothetical protein
MLQDLIKFGAAELFAEEMTETGGVEAGGAGVALLEAGYRVCMHSRFSLPGLWPCPWHLLVATRRLCLRAAMG